MPELPEVETVVRTIRPRIVGNRIRHAEFDSPHVTPGNRELLASQLRDRLIAGVRRHGKFILVDLDQGLLTIHLGMTGKLLFDAPRGVHTHGYFALDHGALLYDDARQFGSIAWSEKQNPRVARLGPDALAVTLEEFVRRLRGRAAKLKSLLLNQAFLAGLGNIYVDEALFRAGLHPLLAAERVSRARAALLFDAIQQLLRESIARGGSSISDYVDGEGRKGSFQDLHRVYGREGRPCVRCGAPIRKTVVAQRGTHWCPQCQRR